MPGEWGCWVLFFPLLLPPVASSSTSTSSAKKEKKGWVFASCSCCVGFSQSFPSPLSSCGESKKKKKRVPCIHILQGCQHTLPLQKGVTHRETATITGRVFCKKRKKKRDKAPSVCIRLAFSNVLFLFLLSCVVFRFRTLFSSSCCTADTLRPDTHTNLKSISLARLLVVSLLRR
jgi:hypothetical protein